MDGPRFLLSLYPISLAWLRRGSRLWAGHAGTRRDFAADASPEPKQGGMTASAYPRPFGELTTVRAALSHLGESFSDQVREASVQLAPPNAPIPGDREVREAFWVLLPPNLQRQFFLRVAGDRRASRR